jgi:hypothetical protein
MGRNKEKEEEKEKDEKRKMIGSRVEGAGGSLR